MLFPPADTSRAPTHQLPSRPCGTGRIVRAIIPFTAVAKYNKSWRIGPRLSTTRKSVGDVNVRYSWSRVNCKENTGCSRDCPGSPANDVSSRLPAQQCVFVPVEGNKADDGVEVSGGASRVRVKCGKQVFRTVEERNSRRSVALRRKQLSSRGTEVTRCPQSSL